MAGFRLVSNDAVVDRLPDWRQRRQLLQHITPAGKGIKFVQDGRAERELRRTSKQRPVVRIGGGSTGRMPAKSLFRELDEQR